MDPFTNVLYAMMVVATTLFYSKWHPHNPCGNPSGPIYDVLYAMMIMMSR